MAIIEFESSHFGRTQSSKLHDIPQVSDIINSLSQPIVALDRRLHITAINKAFHEGFFLWTGLRLYVGMNYLEVLPTEVIQERLQFYRRAFNGERISVQQEYNLAGEIHTFLTTYDPIYSNGEVIGIIGSAKDITAQKQTEKILREANLKFENAFHFSSVGMALTSIDGQFQKVNPTLAKMLGYEVEELQGKRFLDITHPEDHLRNIELKEKLINGEVEWIQIEKRYFHKNGAIIHVCLSSSLVRDEKGLPLYFVTMVQDITERKRAENDKSRLVSILDATPDIVGIFDLQENGIYLNESGRAVFGLNKEDEIGKINWKTFAPWAEKLIRSEGIPSALRRGFWKGETAIYSLDGREIPLSQIILAHTNKKGEVEYLSTIARDVSQQKDYMMELARSNRELEQFAYVASHDLQEPLRMIVSYLQFLDLEYHDKLSKEADEYLYFAVDGAKRMSQLIRDLLTYSKVGRAQLNSKLLNFNEIVDVVLSQLKPSIEQAEVTVEVQKLPHIMADQSQITRLFQNLIENAVKYRGSQKPKIKISSELQGSKYIFKIEDNGIGFEMKDIERIFRLFQRLHERDQYPGSGIGLAIAKSVVERHGGEIWAESGLGKGSTFYFSLPDIHQVKASIS